MRENKILHVAKEVIDFEIEALKNLIAWDDEDVAKGLHILSVEIGRLNVILEKIEETK